MGTFPAAMNVQLGRQMMDCQFSAAPCVTGIAIGVIRCGQLHVTPDVSQSQTVVSYTGKLRPWLSVSDARHAAWRGCERTRIRVWQRCIAVMVGGTVHEEPTELG
ncbi:hypothetical protein HaLaN_08828, partial [Haematococcus lacustris]